MLRIGEREREREREVSRFSVEIVLSYSTETLQRRTFLRFRKTTVSKNFMDKKVGLSRFSVDYFRSHSNETFRKGIFLCFRKFVVTKNFLDKRGISRFSVKNFVFSVLKHFIVELFLVSEKFWYRNFS